MTNLIKNLFTKKKPETEEESKCSLCLCDTCGSDMCTAESCFMCPGDAMKECEYYYMRKE